MNTDETRIRAVTFDLWNTLLFESDNASNMRAEKRARNVTRTLNQLGINVNADRVTAAIDETVNALLQIWDQNKDITHLDQLRLVIRYATNNNTALKDEWISQLSQAYISSLHEVRPYINPDATAVLRQLKNQQKRIGLICNTGITPGFGLRKFLIEEGIAQYFDTMTFSDEVGIRKPASGIFHITSHNLKTKPDETVHIGDNVKADIWGAKNAGFKAIHLQTQEGIDRIALADPRSMVARSVDLGTDNVEPHTPDKIINRLEALPKAIEELIRQT